MIITIDLTRGEAVYVLAALREHNGTSDLRLTDRTQAVGKVLDAVATSLGHVVTPIDLLSVLGINAPDKHNKQWTVSGDLREIVNLERTHAGTGDSTNHVVGDKLREQGYSIDCEWSCFFGYADTEANAIKLRDEAVRLAVGLRS